MVVSVSGCVLILFIKEFVVMFFVNYCFIYVSDDVIGSSFVFEVCYL